MTENASTAQVLLGAAKLTFENFGFTTNNVATTSGQAVLLAENEYFVIAVAEFGAPAELSSVESETAAMMVELMSGRTTVKRWDAYVVLLSSARQDGESVLPEFVAAIVYDTKFFRRIVRWDVRPERQSLVRALRPFLPLASAQKGPTQRPADRLVSDLASFGIDPDDARAAAEAWRQEEQDNVES